MTRVLIIDDDLDMRDQIATTLVAAFYETHTAVDGHDGVLKALQAPPDLIVCDMTMPNMNGQQVLEELRQHPETATVPFIFLTAIDNRATVRESMNMGADDYLFKPFQVDELLRTVSTRLKYHNQIKSTVEQQLESLKLRLAHTITHELRTPLGHIVTSLGLMSWHRDKLTKEDLDEMIDTMNAGANRLSHCVEQMVFITQLTTGVVTPDTISTYGMPLSIPEILAASVNMARQFTPLQAENVNVRVAEPKEEMLVKGDPAMLKQAFAEIISNGLTFSPANGTLRVNAKRSESEIRIAITDSGPGIPDEKLNDALAWFGQVDREVREQQGMGMGLPLANQLVMLHGGTMDIRSVVDKGTQVIISLPATEAAQ